MADPVENFATMIDQKVEGKFCQSPTYLSYLYKLRSETCNVGPKEQHETTNKKVDNRLISTLVYSRFIQTF